MNLKQALQQHKLDQFITEHSKESGDQEQFDATLDSMVGKSKEAPVTSKLKRSGD